EILTWYNTMKRNNEKRIQILTAKMEALRAEGKDKDWETWCSTKLDLDKAYSEEEQFWRAKSRALWIQAGDRNTRFFHAFTAQRRKRNSILRLVA
ncbi:DNAse I-like superfamily protein, partial [Striga hermonthica]